MPSKPYRDEAGNLVVPVNQGDARYINDKVNMFKKHGKRAQQEHLDIARNALKANMQKGGSRGSGTD